MRQEMPGVRFIFLQAHALRSRGSQEVINEGESLEKPGKEVADGKVLTGRSLEIAQ